MENKRSAKSDLERRRPTFLKIGLIASLAFALMAFEHTTWSPTSRHLGEIDITFTEVELPPLVRKKKVEPEQKKQIDKDLFKVVKEPVQPDPDPIPDPDPQPDPDPKFFDLDSIDDGFDDDTLPPEPFISVERMPHFTSCAHLNDNKERSQCTEIGFIRHLSDHLRVPRDLMRSEKAFVYFVVSPQGTIVDLKMRNKVSPSLEREIRRVFALLPEMIPGEQRNRKVPVQYTIPVNVKIK